MDGYGKRVLIVDDDEHTRRLMGIMLEQAEYNIVAVRDGLDAMHEVARRHFDAVITDFFMPGLNGGELLKQIHAMRPEIPVILVSGSFHDDPEAVQASQFFACLRKPFENVMLLELLRSAVQSSAAGVPTA